MLAYRLAGGMHPHVFANNPRTQMGNGLQDGMEIGHDKCGVMVVHDAEAHTQAKQQEWSCQNGFIQVVDQYSYLGTCLDTSLSVKTMIQHRADIGKHALAPLVPLLASAKIPTRIKTMVIKTILIPKICYGAEIWGDSVPTYKPLSQILTEAIIWAATSSKNKNVVADLDFQKKNMGGWWRLLCRESDFWRGT